MGSDLTKSDIIILDRRVTILEERTTGFVTKEDLANVHKDIEVNLHKVDVQLHQMHADLDIKREAQHEEMKRELIRLDRDFRSHSSEIMTTVKTSRWFFAFGMGLASIIGAFIGPAIGSGLI